MRQAELRHDIPILHFPAKPTEPPNDKSEVEPMMNTSRRCSNEMSKKGATSRTDINEFEDDGLDDVDLIAAGTFLIHESMLNS